MKFKLSNSTPLLKASYFNAILVFVKVATAIITSKVIAIFLGPSGLALLGNLKNFIQTASSFTAEGYQNGTIRYVSEMDNNEKQKDKISATIFQLSLGFSLIIGVFLFLFASFFSRFVFQTIDYDYIIKLIGICLPFLSINLVIIYILNGLEDYKRMVIVSSVLSIVNMLTSVILVINYGISGGLVAVILGQVLVFILNLFFLGSHRKILKNIFRFHLFSIEVLRNMNKYFLMAIYSAAIVSINLLLIRNLIIDHLNLREAGYWEAMQRISGFYIMFFTSLTSFYLLPRLSKVDSYQLFKKEIKSFYLLSIPLLIIIFFTIYFLRFILIKVFLNDDFLPTSSLFFWQLIADFISVLAIALVKQFHAKLMIKAYVFCNGLLNILYFVLSYIFIERYGLVGVVKAYALSYFIYLVFVFLFVYNYFKNKQSV